MKGKPASPPAEALAELRRRKRASLGQVLFKAARLMNERAVARVRASGVEGFRLGHTALLPHLDFEGTRLTELAERAGISKQAAGQAVEELERAGVVRREPDPEDGRAKRVRFTPKGLQGLLYGLSVLTELEEGLAARLGRTRTEALREGLVALLEVLEVPDEAPPAAPRSRRRGRPAG
jgi:DNA-binding MarR family transcriptional regulator